MAHPDVRTRLRAHGNLLVVIATSFVGGLQTSMIGVVWQPFVLSLGASMSILGLLTSLGGISGIIPTLVSPIGGWFADRRGRKYLMLGASAASMLAYGLYTFAGLGQVALVLVPGIVCQSLMALARPASSALVGESVGAARYGSAYSMVTFATIVPGVLAPLAAGWLADRLGYTSIFPLALCAEIVSFVLIARYLQETGDRPAKELDWGGLVRLLRHAWFPPPGLGAFFIASSMDAFSWGMGWGLLYGLLSKEYAFDAAQLGILSSIMSITWAVTQLPIGRFIDRSGAKAILAVSEAVGAPLLLIWMTQTRFEIIALSMPLFALNAALWIPARSSFISHTVRPEQRAETFGRLAAFVGLISFPSALIGGGLFDHFGFSAPILANLIGSLLALLVIVFFVREPRSSKNHMIPSN
jgi:DHA1 family multidrug resistance protein-like MFS transporter